MTCPQDIFIQRHFYLHTLQQTEQVNVVGANVEVGGDSDTDSDGFVIDEDATVG